MVAGLYAESCKFCLNHFKQLVGDLICFRGIQIEKAWIGYGDADQSKSSPTKQVIVEIDVGAGPSSAYCQAGWSTVGSVRE